MKRSGWYRLTFDMPPEMLAKLEEARIGLEKLAPAATVSLASTVREAIRLGLERWRLETEWPAP